MSDVDTRDDEVKRVAADLCARWEDEWALLECRVGAARLLLALSAERDEAIQRGNDWCDQVQKLRAERDMWRAENAKKVTACEQMGARITALEAEREAARREEREMCAALCEAWAKMDADIGALKAAVTRILGPDWPDDGLPVARAREWAATREYTARGLADAIRAR